MKRILALEEGPGFGGALMSLKYLLENSDPEKITFDLITNYQQDYIVKSGPVRTVLCKTRSRLHDEGKLLIKLLKPIFRSQAGPAAYLIDRFTFCQIYSGWISRYIKRNNIQLVHLNNWPLLNDGGLLAAKKAGVPVIMHVRGLAYSSRLISWLAKQADHIIAISVHEKNKLLELGISENNITVIPNAVDSQRFRAEADGSAFKKSLDLPEDVPLIGMIGCLVGWKGHKVFLDACAQVFKNTEFHAVIVGDTPNGDSEFRIELQNHARCLGIFDKTHFAGHRRDVASAMAACDIIVHASTEPEPFGRVIIEAMALGKPVVATSPGGPSEIIENGVDGFLVPPADSYSMANCILKLLENKDLMSKLSLAAGTKVDREYNVSKYVQRVEAIYNKYL